MGFAGKRMVRLTPSAKIHLQLTSSQRRIIWPRGNTRHTSQNSRIIRIKGNLRTSSGRIRIRKDNRIITFGSKKLQFCSAILLSYLQTSTILIPTEDKKYEQYCEKYSGSARRNRSWIHRKHGNHNDQRFAHSAAGRR